VESISIHAGADLVGVVDATFAMLPTRSSAPESSACSRKQSFWRAVTRRTQTDLRWARGRALRLAGPDRQLI
jgi:hypothetical protein